MNIAPLLEMEMEIKKREMNIMKCKNEIVNIAIKSVTNNNGNISESDKKNIIDLHKSYTEDESYLNNYSTAVDTLKKGKFYDVM